MRSLRMEPLHIKKPAQGGPETKKPPLRVASTVNIRARRTCPPEFHICFAKKSNRGLLVARIGKRINKMQATIPLPHKQGSLMELIKIEHFGYPFFNTLIATRVATTPTHHYVMFDSVRRSMT